MGVLFVHDSKLASHPCNSNKLCDPAVHNRSVPSIEKKSKNQKKGKEGWGCLKGSITKHGSILGSAENIGDGPIKWLLLWEKKKGKLIGSTPPSLN